MTQIQSFEFNAFAECTYVVYNESKQCIIVDPGCFGSEEQNVLKDFISDNKLEPVLLVNTHCHVDHILGNYFIKETFNVPFLMHRLEVPVLQAAPLYTEMYGFPGYQGIEPDSFLEEGNKVIFGTTELEALLVPGHAPGHIALVSREEKICLSGDVLFRHSIGRTDIPYGDFDTLLQSIRTKLFLLSDDTVVYPGHGPTTTIGEEKRYNPFCALTEQHRA